MVTCIGAILVPPGVEGASDIVNDMPRYAEELTKAIEGNEQLREINENFDISGKVEDFAEDTSAGALGSAPGALADVGASIVTLFSDFPLDTVIWAGFAIAYQQFENYVVQPRIQSRAVDLDPFIVIVAALFGGTLFGIIGALVAIPTASALQIAVKEFLRYRREEAEA